ncbi:hypothetical protein B0H10DRAFT_2333239, partial [Mycena sp. CBHHK59/15]
MQTLRLCQWLEDAGRLGGAFFFRRGLATRGNAIPLFATIAYQLALGVPALKAPISQRVELDPSVVGRSLERQLQKLITEPCQSLRTSDPRVILIDGLDDCESHYIQQEIVRLLGRSFCGRCPAFRIIVASRPEPQLREVFEERSFQGLCRRVNIEQSFKDVRQFLRDEFARIHREHQNTMATVPTPWPSTETLRRLVKKSSGYFIYASTIIKFIDDKNFRPTERLECIENLVRTGICLPFGALDQLYAQIISNVPVRPQLLRILRVVSSLQLSPCNIEQLLDLIPGEVRLILRGFDSILSMPVDGRGRSSVTMHHASFGDFLRDPTRSGPFYIGDSQAHLELGRSIVETFSYFYDGSVPIRVDHVAWSFGGLKAINYITSSIPPSLDLLPLMQRINPDFLFSITGWGCWGTLEKQCGILSWLK